MQFFFSMNEAISFFSREYRYIVVKREVGLIIMAHATDRSMPFAKIVNRNDDDFYIAKFD
jgi:hypothetical protein